MRVIQKNITIKFKDQVKEYKLKAVLENDELIQFNIESPKELKGLNFRVSKEESLLEDIEEEVKDPFEYIEVDEKIDLDTKSILAETIKNNLIITIAHIEYLNEKLKKEEGVYYKRYKDIEKKVKKWFLEIEDFKTIFEKEMDEINKITDFSNHKDEIRSQDLMIKYSSIISKYRVYEKLKNNFLKKEGYAGSDLSETFYKLMDKTIYSFEVNKIIYRLKPILINDRVCQFELISPNKHKGKYLILMHIPVFVLGMTSVRPYFQDAILTKYGKSEILSLIKEAQFYSELRNYKSESKVFHEDIEKNNLFSDYEADDYLKFKDIYKKVFETNNNLAIDEFTEKEKEYYSVSYQFFQKYSDVISLIQKHYFNILLNHSTVFSYNLNKKTVYTVEELSGQRADTLFDTFIGFFIVKLIKKYSPLHKLPIPKGSFTIANTKIIIN